MKHMTFTQQVGYQHINNETITNRKYVALALDAIALQWIDEDSHQLANFSKVRDRAPNNGQN
jgi:hypothetical protein